MRLAGYARQPYLNARDALQLTAIDLLRGRPRFCGLQMIGRHFPFVNYVNWGLE